MEPYLSRLLGVVQAFLSPAVVFVILIVFAIVAGVAYLLGIHLKERAATQRAELSEGEQTKRTLIECNTRLLERAIERGLSLRLELAGERHSEASSRFVLGALSEGGSHPCLLSPPLDAHVFRVAALAVGADPETARSGSSG